MPAKILIILWAIFVTAVSHAAPEEASKFKITSESPSENEFEITETHINVKSKKGAGRATITLESGQWPEAIKIRLFLGGLEGFVASCGDEHWRRGKLKVQAYKKGGVPTEDKYLKQEGGYYEVTIPKKLIPDGETNLKIHWVNFYL